MKKLILFAFGFIALGLIINVEESNALCVKLDSGECYDIPPDVTGIAANCPNNEQPCNVYSWKDKDTGVIHWVCDNGNSTTYPPPYIPPPFTPEEPPATVCGGPCSLEGNTCPLECPACVSSGSGKNAGYKCQSAPTPTNTPTPKATNTPTPIKTPTLTPTKSPTPTATPTNAPTATPTKAPTPTTKPTATPKPTATATPSPSPTPLPFDESMCSCDGLSYSQNPTIGVPLTVTGYAKVLGANKNYAKIPTMKFALYKTTSGTGVSIVEQSQPISTTIAEETDTKVRYKADWTVNLPATLEKGTTYRIKATPVCSRKSAMNFVENTNRVVLAATDAKPKGLFDRFFSFIASIFGGGETKTEVGNVSKQTSTGGDRGNLGLETFTPSKEVALEVDPADNCTFLRFKF